MTEQELVKKIIKQAEKQAAALITAAHAQADAKVTAAQERAKQRTKEAVAAAQAKLAGQRTEQQKAHEVAVIKAQINAKQAVIDQVFNQVRDNLNHADAATIKKLFTALTQKYAQPGDQITVATNWAKALPGYPTTATITGGIIIENATYRIDLSIDAILATLRPDLTTTVANLLGVL